MSAVRDISCDLIERPARSVVSSTVATPHGRAMRDQHAAIGYAVHAVLNMGALIDWIHVTPDSARIRLARAPRAPVLVTQAQRTYACACHEPGMCVVGVVWRGMRIEWRTAGDAS